MNYNPVLYIGLGSDLDEVDIPSHHGLKPNTDPIPQLNLPYNSGILGQETILTDLGKYAIYRFYESQEQNEMMLVIYV